jgi:hypothetical protein
MSMPNQSGLSSFQVFTSTLSGSPGPASQSGANNMQLMTQKGGASTGQQVATSTNFQNSSLTVPVKQVLGEYSADMGETGVLSSVEPNPSSPPAASSNDATVKKALTTASTGNQTSELTPRSNSSLWATKSTV